jgi:branched-chain amino acid transport system ATP-binding protein
LASSLNIGRIHAAYGAVRVIEDVSLTIGGGETVVLLGTNGNGKSTLMKCIMGMVRPSEGSIVAEIDGVHHDLVGRTTEEIVDLGIALVPEGRRLFPKLTVEENLRLGAYQEPSEAVTQERMAEIFRLFPRLAERRMQLAGTMSGGEQAMVSIGRGLMRAPKLLLIDEPSLGLSPLFVKENFNIIRKINERGISIFLVEQNVHQTLAISDYGYVLSKGRVVTEGKPSELAKTKEVHQAYFG